MPDPELKPKRKLTLDEAIAMMDKYNVVEQSAEEKTKKKEQVGEVKDLLSEGAKQGRAGLGTGTKKQLKQLSDEGY